MPWLPRHVRNQAPAPADRQLLSCCRQSPARPGAAYCWLAAAPQERGGIRRGGGLRAVRAANVNAAPCRKPLHLRNKGGPRWTGPRERLRRGMAAISSTRRSNAAALHQRCISG
jgi:hypothetical protein